MRHATSAALDELEPVLEELRALPFLRERSRGVFTRGGRAFLHFHEDPAGLFADVRLDHGFERFRVVTNVEQQQLLTHVRSLKCARSTPR